VTGGWWDAGNYGRYASPAATTVMSLLHAYRFNPDLFADGTLTIPESGNGVPDLLDEARWELSWLLEMQGGDGAVHHKVDTARIPWPTPRPDQDLGTHHLFDVTTQATAQFAGVMAEASLVYRGWDPAFADTLLSAAKRAGSCRAVHPERMPPADYLAPDGTIIAGQYNAAEYNDDGEVAQRRWAAGSLFHATGERAYADVFAFYWPHRTRKLRVYSLYWSDRYVSAMLAHLDRRAGDESMKPRSVRSSANRCESSSTSFGAAAQLNYVLGTNPLDRTYLTGYGDDSVLYPLNGLWTPGILIPGMLPAGPVAMTTAGCPPVQRMWDENVPFARRYYDASYCATTNEASIYGNAALVALAAWFAPHSALVPLREALRSRGLHEEAP